MKYWLLKSEPDAYSIDDLMAQPQHTDYWDGVRNYQARNLMRNDMKTGDQGFFYHSSCAEPGIVGIVQIVREAYPDFTAFDASSNYYDPKSSPENPRWFMVDVKFLRKLKRPLPLQELKQHTALRNMKLLERGNRLSILPIAKKEWDYILKLEHR